MKNQIKFLHFIGWFFIASSAYCIEVKKENRVDFNPVAPFIGGFDLSYSRNIDDIHSIGVKLAGSQIKIDNKELKGYEVGFIGLRALNAYRNHPFLKGEFLSSQYKYRDSDDQQSRVKFINLKGLVGYTMVHENGLGASIAGGVSYKNGKIRGNIDDLKIYGQQKIAVKDDNFALFHPDIELAISYIF